MLSNNLTGIVLAGGLSERMGHDKSMLNYHGKSQADFVYDLLQNYCTQCFISTKFSKFNTKPEIIDKKELGDVGPIAGLISAYSASKAPFLVIGIDYPLVIDADIVKLINERDTSKIATVYYKSTGFFEPMLAIYEASFKPILLENFEKGVYSLQKILNTSEIKKVLPLNEDRLISVDTPELYQSIYNKINGN